MSLGRREAARRHKRRPRGLAPIAGAKQTPAPANTPKMGVCLSYNANFSSLIALKSLTSPPTRLVA